MMSVWEVNPSKKLVSIQNVADSSLIQGRGSWHLTDFYRAVYYHHADDPMLLLLFIFLWLFKV